MFCREQEEDRLFDAMIEAKGVLCCGLAVFILYSFLSTTVILHSQKKPELLLFSYSKTLCLGQKSVL